MVMLDVVGLMRVAERHPDRFHFRLAEILEHERFDAGVSFDSLVQIAAPPVRTQLASPNYKDIAANNFHPFHESHLQFSKWPWLPGGHEDKFFSTVPSILLMLEISNLPNRKGFSSIERSILSDTSPVISRERRTESQSDSVGEGSACNVVEARSRMAQAT